MKIKTFCFFLTFAIILSGCRVRFPTYTEQQYLLANDAFPGGPPPWMAAPLAASKTGDGGTLGDSLIPQVFGEGVGEIESVAFAASVHSMPRAKSQKPSAVVADPQRAENQKSSESPIDRILQSCSGVESEVSDALQTLELANRIRKYEVLTSRCSSSVDLWLWLARDYQKAKRLSDASRSYEKALLIDQGNQEALTALAEIRSQRRQGR